MPERANAGDGADNDAGAKSPAPYLSIEGVGKTFGSFIALRDIDLDTALGEFVCFLGPSGCGKTTLLRAIAGLEFQSSGTIRQAGRDVSNLPPTARDFGIVFQSYALFPNLTARANIAYGLRKRKRAEVVARVAEMVALVGLDGHEDKHPAQLSGGQQQRVALARALAPSPGLLLLDEPLSALDAKVREHLRHELRAIHRRIGLTTIMVTHDQDEALTLADRIVVMRHGAIEQVGAPFEIYSKPATAFVASFVGRMNFFDGVADGAGGVVVGSVAMPGVDPRVAARDSPVLVSIRPEDIAVAGHIGPADQPLEATVVDVEFLGPQYEAELRVAALGDANLTARLSSNEARALDLHPGGALRLALPAERVRVFARG